MKQCCAAFYGSDTARALLGESFHPGGAELTAHLGNLLCLDENSRVLDVASGRGASAFLLAKRFQCRVVGVDLSEANVRAATEEAERKGIADKVEFRLGDAEHLPCEDASFDAVVCECAFCTFPAKNVAAGEFMRVLKPGGRLGLSDLTRCEESIPELEGLMAWIACIADARPQEQYIAILGQAGLHVEVAEDWDGALMEMARQIQGRLLGIEVLTGLEKIQLPALNLAEARRFAAAAVESIRHGLLGYMLLIASKGSQASAKSALR